MGKDQGTINVIGLGYIGLPTALLFASHGYKVRGVEIKEAIVNDLRGGKVHIDEPEIGQLMKSTLASGNLEIEKHCMQADIFIITVPTPLTREGKGDMSQVIKAVQSMLPYLQKDNIVIIESTCKVGTTEELVRPILEQAGWKIGEDIYLGYCPERVLPGQIIKELKYNSRIIGGTNEETTKRIKAVYQAFVEAEILETDTRTAEMCKLVENSFRDINIAFANELAKCCEQVGINVWELIRLCNQHPRVNVHEPGPGVGGHCIAIDPYFLIESLPEHSQLIRQARTINESMPEYMLDKIKRIVGKLEGEKVTLLGLTYKANSNDLRESPIVKLVELLEKEGCELSIVDSHIHQFRYLEEDILKAAQKSSLIVVGVNHDEFKELPLQALKCVMKYARVLDAKHIYREKDILKWEFEYYLLGGKKEK